MIFSQNQLNKWTNAAIKFAGYENVTIEQFNKEQGEQLKGKKKPKDVKPYYLEYPWQDRESERKFYAYLQVEIRKALPKETEDKIKIHTDIVDSLISLSEINLINKEMNKTENTLF